MEARLLFIDDDDETCEVMTTALAEHGFDVVCKDGCADAIVALEQEQFDAVVSDIRIPGMSGIDFCRHAHANWPELPVVLITAFGSMETAISAIRAGAYDFISKPVQMPELLLTLTRALEHRKLKEENKLLRDTVSRYRPPTDMVGSSAAMQEVHSLLARIADTDATVLITGESGTGKELVAQAVHQRGPRSAGPLIALNCAAVPETILESELFGHARGAFTDARTNRTGLFVQANGGTLFLDEIGEMPPGTQVKLLRALQERHVRPVGANREVPFDARVVSATSRNLEADIAVGRFRQDLYYRIHVIRIHMPPLRDRGSDVLLIAEHFIAHFAKRFGKQVSGLTAPAAEKLLRYAWPGNVREVQNCMERAVALTRSDRIAVQDLAGPISGLRSNDSTPPVEHPLELLTLEEVERRHILEVLQALDGSKTQAAISLGLDRRTLHRKLKAYDLS